MNMSTEYLELNDNRPEFSRKPPKKQETLKRQMDRISTNENKFMNLNLSQIFDKIINILPNLYNDYRTKSLQTRLKLNNNNNGYVSETDIYRETMKYFLFENENIIYLGILIIIIAVFLYIIN